MKKERKNRIDISNMEDFKRILIDNNFKVIFEDKKIYREQIKKIFNLEEDELDKLHNIINNEITYRATNIYEFIDYVKKIIEFEYLHKQLKYKIRNINELCIEREEYERVDIEKEYVNNLVGDIQLLKEKVVKEIRDSDLIKIQEIEEEINREYLYSKDIELLKKILIKNGEKIKEEYYEENNIREIVIKVTNRISNNYIIPKEGTLEYYYHLNSNIPRLKRLIKSIDKYIYFDDSKNYFKINQSMLMQESSNIAIAQFKELEFKAISGKVDIENYCNVVSKEESAFESKKVNKLGEFGQGYNRANDSEKKLIEAINKEIEIGKIEANGELVIYTKLEPCMSCYYVMKKFLDKYPNIKLIVKFEKKYGEKIKKN